MSFKPLTQDKESLQALAFAMRQDKGSDITQDELKEAMMIAAGLTFLLGGITKKKNKNHKYYMYTGRI